MILESSQIESCLVRRQLYRYVSRPTLKSGFSPSTPLLLLYYRPIFTTTGNHQVRVCSWSRFSSRAFLTLSYSMITDQHTPSSTCRVHQTIIRTRSLSPSTRNTPARPSNADTVETGRDPSRLSIAKRPIYSTVPSTRNGARRVTGRTWLLQTSTPDANQG